MWLGSRQTQYVDKLKKLLFFKILSGLGVEALWKQKIFICLYSICCIFVGGGGRDGLWILYFLKYNIQVQVEHQDKKYQFHCILACIGSWGKDCVNRCADGFYGHGCRHKCHCNEQLSICDSNQGCTNRSDTEGKLVI